jgi:hypothetical protein
MDLLRRRAREDPARDGRVEHADADEADVERFVP